MIRELLAHGDYIRVLRSLGRRPRRFIHLELELDLHPPQVSRALKFLRRHKLVIAGAADTATGMYACVYTLTDRGVAMSEALHAFTAEINRRRARLGAEAVDGLRLWWH